MATGGRGARDSDASPARPAGPAAAARPERRPRRLVLAVTHPMTARYLLRGQAGFLQSRGFEVWVAAAPGEDLERFRERESVSVLALPMSRRIRPLADLVALLRLYAALRRLRPHLVNAGTPKAGALGMIAAWMARVPVRVYTLRGLRFETVPGPLRHVLRWAEKTAARLAHRVICVGPSLRQRAIELGLVEPDKAVVLAHGSSNGVDLERFRPRQERAESRDLRLRLGIPPTAPLAGFVGRLTHDKGVGDLASAFLDVVAERVPDSRLLLLGAFEDGDRIAAATRRRLETDPRVIIAGFVPDPAPYYTLMDVLVLPSYREGLPNAPLEAAASAVPTVGYDTVGTVDAIENGVTGRLVAPGDIAALADAIRSYLEDEALRRAHGMAARARAEARFDQRQVWGAWAREYRRLLVEVAGIP